MIKSILIAGLGGFVGTTMRFLLSKYFQLNVASAFPWGTFVINILGCFLIGLFYGLSDRGNIMTADWRLFLTVGVCGGFTTFSTFSNDSILLLQNKEYLYFILYSGLSFILGLCFVVVGRSVTKLF